MNLATGILHITPIRNLLSSSSVVLYTKCRNADVYGFIKELGETANLTGRSAKSTGGCRLLAVEVRMAGAMRQRQHCTAHHYN